MVLAVVCAICYGISYGISHSLISYGSWCGISDGIISYGTVATAVFDVVSAAVWIVSATVFATVLPEYLLTYAPTHTRVPPRAAAGVEARVRQGIPPLSYAFATRCPVLTYDV
eukprot:694944-Rhodomonas_salina.2